MCARGRRSGPRFESVRPPKTVSPRHGVDRASVWASSFASNTVTHLTPAAPLGAASSEVTLRGTGDGPVNPGVDGSVAGTGHFTFTGGINDKATFTGYRSVKGQIAKVRCRRRQERHDHLRDHHRPVTPSAWTITSGTRSYAGLHGKGTLTVDNYESNPYTFVMKGTVSR